MVVLLIPFQVLVISGSKMNKIDWGKILGFAQR